MMSAVSCIVASRSGLSYQSTVAESHLVYLCFMHTATNGHVKLSIIPGNVKDLVLQMVKDVNIFGAH